MSDMSSSDRQIDVGDSTVSRPAGYWTTSVHDYLNHLHQQGFDGAPRPIGHDGRREVVSLIPGSTPGEDFVSPWTRDAELSSVGRLVRRFHEAAATFVPPAWARWQQTSVPTTGTLVCHNDLCRGNVVFRDGQAVGLIDFDFAHPADPLWDLAIAAWHWVPLSDGWRSDVPAGRWPERLRILVEAYGLEPAGRSEILDCLAAFLHNVRLRAVTAGRETGQAHRDTETLSRHRDKLLLALRP